MSKEENGNMNLWNKVEATKPSQTKKVNFGRKITAIDPYHQIKNATEQFGPVGDGWGWDVKQIHAIEATNQIGVLISMWHGDQSDQYPPRRFEQWGQAGLYIDKACKKPDEDCLKKATTDGVTKCLSLLGFNSDIFLGMFDDNKYVKEREGEEAKEVAIEKDNKVTAIQEADDEFIADMNEVWDDIESLRQLYASATSQPILDKLYDRIVELKEEAASETI